MATRFLIFFIQLYQRYLSPFLGETCRFHPTCSHYAIIALQQYGPVKGSLKTVWRILRCNPLNSGGIDYP